MVIINIIPDCFAGMLRGAIKGLGIQSKLIIKRSHGATLKATDKNYIAMMKLIKEDLQTKDAFVRKTRSKRI